MIFWKNEKQEVSIIEDGIYLSKMCPSLLGTYTPFNCIGMLMHLAGMCVNLYSIGNTIKVLKEAKLNYSSWLNREGVIALDFVNRNRMNNTSR